MFVWALLAPVAYQTSATTGVCLPEKDSARIGRASSVDERLLIYGRIVRRESSRARERVAEYRPWQEGGGAFGVPSLPTLDEILSIHNCALSGMLEELKSWRPQGSSANQLLTSLRKDLTKAEESLRVARRSADPFEELHPLLQRSLALLGQVESKMDEVLRGP